MWRTLFCWKNADGMALEIERKFIVDGDSYKTAATGHRRMEQGYLCTDADATVRVRIAGESAYITVKSRNKGAVRGEWEYGIPVADARQLLALCGDRVLAKTRWFVPAGSGMTWEVDEFDGRLAGLTVAEIELPAADTPLPPLPPFIGREVTGDPRYYNSRLVGESFPLH